MSAIRYVTMNPTGNLTCLVLDPVPEKERSAVTAALMNRCEQVGYIYMPTQDRKLAHLQMMGGEFCGNATMAAAAWLCREGHLQPGDKRMLTLEVSGANEPVPCQIRALGADTWEGTVRMPKVLSVSDAEPEAERIAEVRLEGITHLIREGTPLSKSSAENLLLRIAEESDAPAVGLLQWDPVREWMDPLVFVRKSGTLVWESGCGSGSTAIGAWLGMKKEEGRTEICVNQPGGCIRVQAEIRNGRAELITITGKVTLMEEGQLERISCGF